MAYPTPDATSGVSEPLARDGARSAAVARIAKPQTVRDILAFCVFEIAFYFAYRYGMSFTQTSAAPFWFPDSVLLCALLRFPRRAWPLLLLATLPIRLLVAVPDGTPQWFLWVTFAIDCAKAILAATLLRRLLANPLRFDRPRDFALYCLCAVILVPSLGAVAGAGARHVLGDEYWTGWREWFFGDAAANLILTPLLFYWVLAPPRLRLAGGRRWAEAALIFFGLLVSTWRAFHAPAGQFGFTDPRFYIPVAFLVWAALRFGMAGASGAVAVLALVSVSAALLVRGPFSGHSPGEAAAALQKFLLLRAAPLYLFAVLIEQNRRVEQSLRESEQRYREVVESQSDLVCRFLADTTLTFVNAAYCRFLGREREELLGTRLLAWLPERARELARTHIESCAARRASCAWECEVSLPNGETGWQHWRCHAILDRNGSLVEHQAIGHDITDRKHAEEANRKLAHTARLAVVGELTAMVAHEVNQPLCAIMSNAEAAEMLLDTADPPLTEVRQILADICQDDLRAHEAIRRIRALVQNREMQLQPLDLNSAIADVLRISTGDALRRRVKVEVELGENLPAVSADRLYLTQVLLNLIVNGMDAMVDTPEASRQLLVRTAANDADHVEVSVTDCGHGIAADKMPHLFDSFFTTKPDGMGLGLSIARSIIQAHQGHIWAENRASGGACFRFTLRTAAGREIE